MAHRPHREEWRMSKPLTQQEISEIIKNHYDWGHRPQSGTRSRANLNGRNMQECDFSGAYLEEALMRGAFAMGANFEKAMLAKTSFRGACLSGVNFRNADLRSCDFRGAKMVEADLTGANLHGARLDGADLTGAKLSKAKLTRVTVDGANPIEDGSITADIDLMQPIKGVPKVRVLDENGKEVLRGWYIFHQNTNVCFAEDKPEYYDHFVVVDNFADLNMPKSLSIKRITPPHTIEVITE